MKSYKTTEYDFGYNKGLCVLFGNYAGCGVAQEELRYKSREDARHFT